MTQLGRPGSLLRSYRSRSLGLGQWKWAGLVQAAGTLSADYQPGKQLSRHLARATRWWRTHINHLISLAAIDSGKYTFFQDKERSHFCTVRVQRSKKNSESFRFNDTISFSWWLLQCQQLVQSLDVEWWHKHFVLCRAAASGDDRGRSNWIISLPAAAPPHYCQPRIAIQLPFQLTSTP